MVPGRQRAHVGAVELVDQRRLIQAKRVASLLRLLAGLLIATLLASCGTPAPSHLEASAGEVTLVGAGELIFRYPATWTDLHAGGHTSLSDLLGAVTSISLEECAPDCRPDFIQLPPDSVIMTLTRVSSPFPRDPEEIVPSPAAAVAGLPASVSLTRGGLNGADETITWLFPAPRDPGSFYEISIRIRGPDSRVFREEANSAVAAITFDPPIVPLPTGEGALAEAVGRAIAELAERSSVFECFPTRPGERAAVVSETPEGAPLSEPVAVVCQTGAEPTSVGLWKLVMTIRWETVNGMSGGEHRTTVWVGPDGSVSSVRNDGDAL